MHAVIHLALKKFMEAKYGSRQWLRFLELAALPSKLPYVRLGHYPDAELEAIIAAAARETKTSVDTLVEEFGFAIATDLITMYPRLIKPEWRTLDLLANTEKTIHEVVRQRQPGIRPALLQCERLSPEDVQITYTSNRRLCALAQGIIRGVAAHYGEVVGITQPACMLRGDPACVLRVRLENARPGVRASV